MYTVVMLVLVHHIPHIHHRRVWVDYSHSLPNYVPHFLGRDKEVKDLVRLLDPDNTDVRTVSIVGPPGFGKSSLAIHVGHEMVDRGVVVNYVNLDEIAVDGIPEKIIGNAGITTMNNSIDRLLKWARDDVVYPVVIILDNCDVILHEERDEFQKFLQHVRRSATTVMIKFLLTTKHKINFLDEFEEYFLEEISFEASCSLLRDMTKRKIDEQVCRGITKLTGNVPLALKVVGATLRTRTKNITQVIINLERKFLKALNPSDLDQKVNASLVLSYNCLNERQKKLGQYLALFPGSFTVFDACIILEDVIGSDCDSITAEIEVLDQRSLLQFLGKGRYQFHKITKEFFSAIEHSHEEKHISAFLTRFLVRYGNKLYHLSVIYENDYISALHTLGIEKHNFQHLLYHSEDICLMDREHSFLIFEALQVTLKMRFLTSQFTTTELRKPFADICKCLLHFISTVGLAPVRLIIDPKQAKMVMRAMEILIHITVQLYGINLHDITHLEEVKVQLDVLEGIVDVPAAAELYYVLGSHYHALDELEEEKRCHEKILQRANAQLDTCVPGSCDYNSLSRAHYHLEKYELGAHFLELDLKYNRERMSSFALVNNLEMLYMCQSKVRNQTMAKATLQKMLPVLPSLIDANTQDIYSNLEMLSSVTLILRINGKANEATKLEKKQIMAIKKMNATDTRFDKSFAQKATALAKTLFEAGQYDEVPEVAKCALKLLKNQNKYIQRKIELELILGKAEYYNGKRSASINSLKEVVRSVVHDHPLYNEMGKEACQYMSAQLHLDITCLLIVWREVRTIGYSVLMLMVSDTVTFPTSTYNQHDKALSTDIAPRSSYWDVLPSELTSFYDTILELCKRISEYTFLDFFTTLYVSILLRVINFVLIPAKFLVFLSFFSVYCYNIFCFLTRLVRRMFRV